MKPGPPLTASNITATSPRIPVGFLILLIGICILPTFINIKYGIGENIDAYSILDRARSFAGNGVYLRSRSWGYPLYEVVAYPLLNWGGITAAKLYSLAWLAASVGLAALKLRLDDIPTTQLWAGVAAFAWLPCTIISGNSVMETSQSLALGLAGVYFFLTFLKQGHEKQLIVAMILTGLALGTRPCHVILLASIVTTLTLFRLVSFPRLLALTALSSVLGFAPYFFLYHSLPWQPGLSIIDTGDPMSMKLVKTVIGYIAVLGIPAWAVLMAAGIRHLSRAKSISTLNITPWGVFYTLVTLLYLIRIMLLPDEIEYAYFWGSLTLLFFIPKLPSRSWVVILAFASALPNFVQLHFFDRGQNGAVISSWGFSVGAIEQDRQYRQSREFMRSDYMSMVDQQWNATGCTGPRPQWTSFFAEGFPFSTSANCEFVSLKWYARMRDYVFPSQGRQMERFLLRYDKTLLIHSFPTDRGWRRFLKFEQVFPIRPEMLQFKIHLAKSAVTGLEERKFWLAQ